MILHYNGKEKFSDETRKFMTFYSDYAIDIKSISMGDADEEE
jgi:hypothetical protein